VDFFIFKRSIAFLAVISLFCHWLITSFQLSGFDGYMYQCDDYEYEICLYLDEKDDYDVYLFAYVAPGSELIDTETTDMEKIFNQKEVQDIDTYFGVLDMHFSFRDNLIGVQMVKAAEDFFGEYQGFAGGEIMC